MIEKPWDRRNWPSAIGLIAALVLAVAPAGVMADPAEKAQANQKAAQAPSDLTPEKHKEITELIKQLGDDSYDTREAATKKLMAMGPVAAPALRKAAESPDIEVRNRAKRALVAVDPQAKAEQEAQQRAAANPPAGGPAPFGLEGLPLNGVRLQFRVMGQGGAANKNIRIQEDGRQVQITEDAKGIRIELTETDAMGKSVTKTYEAKTAEELRQNSPEGYALYERYAGGGDGEVIQIGPGLLQPGAGGIMPPRLIWPGLGDNNAARERQRKMLEEMLKPLGPQGEDLLKQLGELEALQRDLFGGNNDINGLLKRLDEMERRLNGQEGAADRQKAQVQRRNAVGAVAAARFGVQVEVIDALVRNQMGLRHGLVVRRVAPNSRAARLGLSDFDIITKLNTVELHTIADLTRALEAAGADKLSVEGLRGGQALKLEEK